MNRKTKWLLVLVGIVALIILRSSTDFISFNETKQDFALWSILPAVIALILCFATREVIPSLFAGIVVGGVISGKFNIEALDKFLF